ncbi:hypothetical protein HWV62_28710 [Athelia sp. TMB]|nr:hypothetical protein HWV62_28710 [Athelia sp. TMB]
MHQVNGDRQRLVLSLAKDLEKIANTRRKLEDQFALVKQELEEKIARAERELIPQLENLDAQEKVILLEHNLLHNLDAPTSNLPDEILAMVFEAGMVRDSDDRFYFGERVSHVSHRWRCVALSTPCLWAHIWYRPLQVQGYEHEIFEASVGRGSVYLSRSRRVPLDIRIHVVHNSDISPDFLQSIREHIGHCRSLSMIAEHGVSLPSVIEATSYQVAPMLTSLELSIPITDSYSQFSTSFLPHGAPLLRTVHLSGIDYDTAPLWLPALASVTNLRLTNIVIEDSEEYVNFQNALAALQSLSHLELTFEEVASSSPHLSIVLPALRYLHVDFKNCRPSLRTVMTSIHAPTLFCLSLAGFHKKLSLIEPTSVESRLPSLRHVVLVGSVLAALSELESLAMALPKVEQVTYRCDQALPDGLFFQVLKAHMADGGDEDAPEEANKPADQAVWPNLRTIAISALQGPPDVLSLRRIILRLRQAGSSIHTLLLPGSCVDNIAEVLQNVVKIERFIDEWPMPFQCFQ